MSRNKKWHATFEPCIRAFSLIYGKQVYVLQPRKDIKPVVAYFQNYSEAFDFSKLDDNSFILLKVDDSVRDNPNNLFLSNYSGAHFESLTTEDVSTELNTYPGEIECKLCPDLSFTIYKKKKKFTCKTWKNKMKWKCPVCSTKNNTLICKKCKYRFDPIESSKEESDNDNDKKWNCLMCSYRNDESAKKCKMCKTRRRHLKIKISTLRKCIENVFKIDTKLLSSKELVNLVELTLKSN
jgi:hypothetical protein